jgi:hypothetical protein
MDSGATNNFIDQQFVEKYHILMLQKDSPRKLHVADGREIDTGRIAQEVKQIFNFGEFSCELNIDVTNMGTDDAVFGMPWLEDLGAKPDFENRTIQFSSKKLRGKPNKSYNEEVVCYNHSNQSYTIRCQTASLSRVVVDKTPSSGKSLSRAFQRIYSEANPMSGCGVITTPDSEGIRSGLSRIDSMFGSKWGSRTYGDTRLGVSPKFLQEAQALPFLYLSIV